MSSTATITWEKPYRPWPTKRMRSPLHDEALTRFATEVGGTFLQGYELFGLRKPPQVSVYTKPWTILFDTYDVSAPGGWARSYTRVRASYISKDPFEFKIYCPGFFSKLVAAEEFETGHPEFDRTFAVEPQSDPKAQAVIENPKIRRSIQSLLVNGNDPVLKSDSILGWCDGYQTLGYEEGAVITDVGRLKSILELFNEVLNHLCHIGSATKDDPHCML
jgi:hypothetical protein